MDILASGALSADTVSLLGSGIEIARQLGVSKGFLNYHHGDLCAKYARHRTACRNKKAGAEIERSTAFLLSGPIVQYPSGKFPSLDHLAEAAVQELGVGVRIARIAVGVALKKQLGRREATRRRKAAV
jgi:hypothetical protein